MLSLAIHVAGMRSLAIHVAGTLSLAIHVAGMLSLAIHVAGMLSLAIHVAGMLSLAIHVAGMLSLAIHVAGMLSLAIHVAGMLSLCTSASHHCCSHPTCALPSSTLLPSFPPPLLASSLTHPSTPFYACLCAHHPFVGPSCSPSPTPTSPPRPCLISPTRVSNAAMLPRMAHTPNHCSPPHLFLPTPSPLPPIPCNLLSSHVSAHPHLAPHGWMPPIHSSTSSPAALHATWMLCSEAPRRRASVGVYLPPIPLRHPPTDSPTPFLKTPLKDKWMPTSTRMQTAHAAPTMASASAVGCMRGAPRIAAKSDPREAGLRPCAEMCAAADGGAGCSDAEGDWCSRGWRFAVLMGAARCTRM
ncbi:unnamed protein product [Closterium sp. NIES-53]